jgi:hypothetical protein
LLLRLLLLLCGLLLRRQPSIRIHLLRMGASGGATREREGDARILAASTSIMISKAVEEDSRS